MTVELLSFLFNLQEFSAVFTSLRGLPNSVQADVEIL
jgi:hypothetical protein